MPTPVLSGCHIDYFHFHQIAAAQLAVDSKVEERQVAMVFGQLKPYESGSTCRSAYSVEKVALDRRLLCWFNSANGREDWR